VGYEEETHPTREGDDRVKIQEAPHDGRLPIVRELGALDIRGTCAIESYELPDGSSYTATYRYAQYGERFVLILESVEQWMPPSTPQTRTFTDADRLPMMDEHGCFSVRLEAEQRRQEWDDVNKGLFPKGDD